VLVHADESCLGNQNKTASRGGAGALIEVRIGQEVVRKDFFLSSGDTTNNRMALIGAIDLLKLLAGKGNALNITYVSDSKYLVQGITEWVHGWKRRGWKRKTGAIENVEMWRELDEWNQRHRVTWKWVRGHAGHAKNEYADFLAVSAAEGQLESGESIDSGFDKWLETQNKKSKFVAYDANGDFRDHEQTTG
jgi:ribonuclease HI